jgi:hypothetical protein
VRISNWHRWGGHWDTWRDGALRPVLPRSQGSVEAFWYADHASTNPRPPRCWATAGRLLIAGDPLPDELEADAEQLYDLYFGRTTLRDDAIAVRGAQRGEVDSWFAWSRYTPGLRAAGI